MNGTNMDEILLNTISFVSMILFNVRNLKYIDICKRIIRVIGIETIISEEKGVLILLNAYAQTDNITWIKTGSIKINVLGFFSSTIALYTITINAIIYGSDNNSNCLYP